MSFKKPIVRGNVLNFIQSTDKFARKEVQEFLMSRTIVTLNDRQGDPNTLTNIEFCGLYHYIKFERNRSVNVLIQESIKVV